MREIKFRAWDKEQNYMFKIFDNITQEDWYLPQWKDRFEVMQFTGLKDKNGVDVYEEDICRDGNGKIGVVKVFGGTRKMPNGFGGFEQFGLYKKCDDGGWQHFKRTNFNELEVIGNIYENPDLLEKGAAK